MIHHHTIEIVYLLFEVMTKNLYQQGRSNQMAFLYSETLENPWVLHFSYLLGEYLIIAVRCLKAATDAVFGAHLFAVQRALYSTSVCNIRFPHAAHHTHA
jgi:hypothetical protein